jgi:SAM-dependent methyltransferase
VRAGGASGVGLDPGSGFVEQARAAVADAGLDQRIEVVEGEMQRIPCPDGSFDLVWCRDVIELVEDLDAGLAEVARVLRPGGQLLVFAVLATDRLEPKEARMLLGQNLAVVPANLVAANVEGAFRRAGLALLVKDEIGTEWREHAEERSHPASQALLRLARLRRQRDRIVERAGEDIYAHVESNLHWLVYQFLGKLVPVLHLLQRPA